EFSLRSQILLTVPGKTWSAVDQRPVRIAAVYRWKAKSIVECVLGKIRVSQRNAPRHRFRKAVVNEQAGNAALILVTRVRFTKLALAWCFEEDRIVGKTAIEIAAFP